MQVNSDDLFTAIMEAHAALRPQLPFTPLTRSSALSLALGCDVWLKCDHLQATGAFKLRGASNKIRLLDTEARRAGVITSSTGNHGLAVAHAGRNARVPVTVYLSTATKTMKIDAIRGLGAEIVMIDGTPLDAEVKARADAAATGIVYISPYNDLDVVAGQGTLGAELMEQETGFDAVFICTGCGGLMGGTGTVMKRLSPKTRMVGVWPQNSVNMLRSLEAGHIVEVPEQPTLSDGSAGAVEPGSVTFPICQAVIDDTETVSEVEIADAMRRIAESERWMIEGAAGVAVAGLIKRREQFKGAKVCVVLCGRNIALDTFLKTVA